MKTVVFFLIGATCLLFVSSTPSRPELTLASPGSVTKNLTEGFLHENFSPNVKTDSGMIDAYGLVPWRCFAKQSGSMCSCTILEKTWVMVKRSCIESNDEAIIEVHAGGINESYAEQVVGAAIFSAPEPSPDGVTFLQLNASLNYTENIKPANLTTASLDFVYGIVSGFHYHDNTTYHSEYFLAGIYEKLCIRNRLCGFGHKDDWPDVTNDRSNATDFLDYYDGVEGKFYFVGVLDRHHGRRVATYFKVKDMLPWIEKYTGISVHNSP